MPLPPKDVSPSELFQKLTSTERPHRVVDVPRKGPNGEAIAQVAIVVLTDGEMTEVAAEAERRARKMLASDMPGKEQAQAGYLDVYNNIAAVEILFRALRDPEDRKKPAFRTPHEIQQALTIDEVGVLYSHYQIVQQELGPIVATMTDAEVDDWIRVLAEGASAAPLGLLSSDALRILALILATRLHALATDSSSPGSPAESTSTDSETSTPLPTPAESET